MMYKNLRIIGTSHIAISSIENVREIILKERPEFIALELDRDRLFALMSDKKRKVGLKDIGKLGVSGFLFAVFGQWVEEKLGKMVGTKPGGEMKEGVKCAAKIGSKVVLIDQKINITIKNLMREITFKEKLRFVWDIIKGVVFRKGDIEKFDLRKVPPEKLIEKMLASVQKRYPNVYKTLVLDRNKYMGRKLHKLITKFPDSKIVVIIGAGHEKGLVEEIKKYK